MELVLVALFFMWSVLLSIMSDRSAMLLLGLLLLGLLPLVAVWTS